MRILQTNLVRVATRLLQICPQKFLIRTISSPSLSQINTPRPTVVKMDNNIHPPAAHEVTDIANLSKGQKKKKKKAKKAKNAVAQTIVSPRRVATVVPNPLAARPQQPQHFAAKSPSRPMPTPIYLQQASLEPTTLPGPPQPLLIVLDLNGCLLHRKKSKNLNFVTRDGTDRFLAAIMERYTVMVWSSAQKANVEAMVNKIFHGDHRHKLVNTWDRSYLGLSKRDFYEKVQVYKRLELVWGDPLVKASHPWAAHNWIWDQSNTVLIDDTSEKAASEPYNIIETPTYEGKNEARAVLDDVLVYLDILQHQRNVSSYIRMNPFKIGAGLYT